MLSKEKAGIDVTSEPIAGTSQKSVKEAEKAAEKTVISVTKLRGKPLATAILMLLLCIFINWLGKYCISRISAPFWLDSVGTAFAGFLYGPFWGAVTGGVVNVIYGIWDTTALYYAPINIIFGIMVGLRAKKGKLRDLRDVMVASRLFTPVCAFLSTPLNMVLSDGKTGNVWGDGIFELLRKWGTPQIPSAIIAEYYIDAIDKTLTLLILFVVMGVFVRLIRREPMQKSSRSGRIAGFVLLAALMIYCDVLVSCMIQTKSNPFALGEGGVIYETKWFRAFFLLEMMLIVTWYTWLLVSFFAERKITAKELQLALAKRQVEMSDQTILAIARAVDARDENTSNHSVRVSEYAVKIARELGYSEEELDCLKKAALLHDIGKIGIPDSVLKKPDRLTDEEYAIIKTHVTIGAEILGDFSLLPHIHEGTLYHHERYDGRGYASGLKGEDIPEFARIIGIADAFDAMTANRVYRKKMDMEYVLGEIRKGRGTQFDPNFTDIFLELIERGEIKPE